MVDTKELLKRFDEHDRWEKERDLKITEKITRLDTQMKMFYAFVPTAILIIDFVLRISGVK